MTEKLVDKIWVLSKFNIQKHKEISYSSSKEFKESFCYQFMKNKKLIVKQSNGKCMVGESKIDYEVVEGKWARISDSIISISHKYRGYTKNEKLKITKLTENELTLTKVPFK